MLLKLIHKIISQKTGNHYPFSSMKVMNEILSLYIYMYIYIFIYL
jgi:hypothetical protein